jgi:hypothetical protein
MKYAVETITRQTPRPDLVDFLNRFEGENRGEDFWRRRMTFWWDDNPFQSADLPCGWVARCEGRVVGVLAALHFEYVHRGKIYPALNAGTWRVAKEHRNVSLPMFVGWHRWRDRVILLDTTPNAEVTQLLDRFNYSARKTATNHFIPLPRARAGLAGLAYGAANRLARWTLPRRPQRLVSLKDSFIVRNEWIDFNRLEKRITREYLNWYCQWPPKEFIGCTDETDALTSYAILEPESYGRHRALSIIDHFTMRPDNREILALVRHLLAHHDGLALKGDFDFLMLNTLEDDFVKQQPLVAIHRQNPGKHHYSLPPELAGVPKRCVIAEGDYGC